MYETRVMQAALEFVGTTIDAAKAQGWVLISVGGGEIKFPENGPPTTGLYILTFVRYK